MRSSRDLAREKRGSDLSIQLRLFGGFEASVDGELIASLRAPAPVRLLSYLALHRPGRTRRVFLAGLFWPDGSDSRARRRLSHTLWVLQQAVAPAAPTLIQPDRESIGLDPNADLWIDVEEFEQQLLTADELSRSTLPRSAIDPLMRAVELYRGDLLADHYDEWLEAPRQQLRERFLVALRQLASQQKRRGLYDAALVNARRLVSETPLAESAHAELMRLYWLTNRPDEALAHFAQFCDVLIAELGIEPSEELTSLRLEILAARRAVEPTKVSSSQTVDVLVGRTAERTTVLGCLDPSTGETSSFCLVEGGPGIGKTRLIADVADAARWRGSSVVWAHHGEHAVHEPYGGLIRALSSDIRGVRRAHLLNRLEPELIEIANRILPTITDFEDEVSNEGLGSPDERHQLHEALTQCLIALGDAAPLVLVFDDFQWADPGTLELLRFAAPALAAAQVTTILCYRQQEARPRPAVWRVITDLEGQYRATRVSLQGLGPEAVKALIEARCSLQVSPAVVRALETTTGGTPLFLIETLRALEQEAREQGAETIDDRWLAWLDEGLVGVEGVVEVLLRHIQQSTPEVEAVVRALAVWDGPATLEQLAALTELDRGDVIDAVRSALDAQFVAETEQSYVLRFAQLASVARTATPSTQLRQLHQRALAILKENRSADPGVLARHCRQAGMLTDAAQYEGAAGVRAMRLHAFETAIERLRAALRAYEEAEVRPTPGLLFRLESALDILGRRDEQAEVLDRIDALELGPKLRLRLLQRRSMLHANSGQMYEAIRTSTFAIGFAIASGSSWVDPVANLAKILVLSGRPQLAHQHLANIDLTAASSETLAQAHLSLGHAMLDLQDFGGARQQLEAALQIAAELRDRRLRVEILAAKASLETQLGHSRLAEREYEEAIGLAREIGARYGEAVALSNLALLKYMQSDIAGTMESMLEAAAVFRVIGDRRGEAMVRVNGASIMHLVLGSDDQAEREAAKARVYFTEIGDSRHEAQCLDVLAGVRRRRRSYAVARRLLEVALRAIRSSGDRWLEVQLLRSLAWNELDAGRIPAAQEAASQAVRLCHDVDLGTELPALLALQSRALARAGETSAARLAAQDSMRRSDSTSELRHIAAWWCHQTLLATGDEAEASTQLHLAHLLLTKLLHGLDDEKRQQSLDRIAEHRNIMLEHARRFPRAESVTLASNGSTELVIDLRWTPHQPEDLLVEDRRDRRQRRLVRLLDEARSAGARPHIADLADALDISVSTVKRDLAALRAEGLVD